VQHYASVFIKIIPEKDLFTLDVAI